MTSPSGRPTYSKDGLSKYLEYIGLPSSFQDGDRNLTNLRTLQQHQLARIPFENLALHYSPDRTIHLDADYLYDKIVNRSRGGYCMENNAFFGTILRSLGFKVRSVGARVNTAMSTSDVINFSGWYLEHVSTTTLGPTSAAIF